MKYQDSILMKIKEILEKDGPKELKGRYDFGEPIVVSKSQLKKPSAFIYYGDSYEIHDSAGGEIETNAEVQVCVVIDMSRQFTQDMNVRSHLELVDLVAGRKSDMVLKKNTIVEALRANEDPGERLWIDAGTLTQIEFDNIPRENGIVTAEAIVKFTVKHSQFRPDLV